MAQPTWEERERPVLEAIAECQEAGADPSNEQVAASTGLDLGVVGRTMKRLHDAGFIQAVDVTSLGDDHPQFVAAELLERVLRVVGSWPPEVSDAFLQRIDSLIATASDPEERSRLERLRAAAGEISKGVISGAIVAAGQWGLS